MLFNEHRPPFVFSCLGTRNTMTYDDIEHYIWLLEECAISGATVLHMDTPMNLRWSGVIFMTVVHGKGNVSFACTPRKYDD